MKYYKYSALFFLIQTIGITVWYAVGVDTDDEAVKNFKFFAWVISLVTSIFFFIKYLKKAGSNS